MFITFEQRLKIKINKIYEQLKNNNDFSQIFLDEKTAKRYIVLKLAQNNLLLFTMLTHQNYKISWAHEILCKKLEQIESKKIDRLIVIAPPRFGKSEISSIRFPVWFLGRNPTKKVMAVSYNSDLVSDFGRDSRNCINSEEYRNIFGIDKNDDKDIPQLAKDSKSVVKFSLLQGGKYVGQGLQGGVTGKGGHVVLIDDWIRDHRDLNNKKLEDDWEYYKSTLYNRQEEEAAFIVIQTHWHKKDLIGKLEEGETKNGDKWEKILFSAEAIKDEYYNKEDFYWYD